MNSTDYYVKLDVNKTWLQDTNKVISLYISRSCRLVLGFIVALAILAIGFTVRLNAQAAEPAPLVVTSTGENLALGYFSDLGTEHDGGVANPTDGSTGNALQQTLVDAYFWGVAHGGARATVVVASEYPVAGSRLLVPGNVDMVCSSYTPQTYTGGCKLTQTDPGDGSATGGSPLLQADFSIGVLPDHKTKCTIFDNPQKPGCVIIDSDGASMSGFTLYGIGANAGGSDVGVRIAANNIHVQDTQITGFFGGPGIQNVVGVNNSYDWNYGTNVDTWWCANPTQFTAANLQKALLISDGSLGGMDLMMTDGEASHNQYSTGCSFSKQFTVSLQYPYMASIHVDGGGDLIQDNLFQTDAIALIAGGEELRVLGNRFEFQAREAVFSFAQASLFANNHILSACLDPNLINLQPGSADSGVPLYPAVPEVLHVGAVIMDANGNVEQVVYGNQAGDSGRTDLNALDWGAIGQGVNGAELIWQNVAAWKPGLTESTDPGPAPALINGDCYGIVDLGQNNTWSSNQVGSEAAVNGVSHYRGSYYIAYPGILTGNACDKDQPDAYGNGQCWWGGDLFSNGGPYGLAPNGRPISAAGGGTAWVGDYSILMLTDVTPQQYNDFQGMSDGDIFWVTSTNAINIINTWGVNGSGGLYGHPSIYTCGGVPLSIGPNQYFQFLYHLSNEWAVTQLNCSTQTGQAAASLSIDNLTFGSQVVGSTSASQTVALTNSGNASLLNTVSVSGPFSQTNNCSATINPGATCTISVSYNPMADGVQSGSLAISDNAAGSPQIVQLTGTGITSTAAGPALMISPLTLTFGSGVVNTASAAQLVTVTNTGGAAAIQSIVTSGNFTQTNACPTYLPTNGSCVISVIFVPIGPNASGGSLMISSNADNSPQVVSLIGEETVAAVGGGIPTLAISSNVSSLLISSVGATGTAPFVVSAINGFTGSTNTVCSVSYIGQGIVNDLPTCSLNPTSFTIKAGTPISGTLSVFTTRGTTALVKAGVSSLSQMLVAGLVFCGLLPWRSRWRNLHCIILCLATSAAMLGCGVTYNKQGTTSNTGGGSGNLGTTIGNYTVVIAVTSGPISTSLSLPLTIE